MEGVAELRIVVAQQIVGETFTPFRRRLGRTKQKLAIARNHPATAAVTGEQPGGRMTRSLLFPTCSCLLFLVGCAGPFDDNAQAEAAMTRRPPGSVTTLVPALPDVSWQFYDCITADQRTGLIAAMLDRLKSDPDLAAVMQGAVGQSMCINGGERGGLFRPSTFGDRTKGLASIDIRPSTKRYAFSAGYSLIQDLAARKASEWPRFDEAGHASPNGRFVVSAITPHLANLMNAGTVTVLDTTNNHTAQLQEWQELYVGPLVECLVVLCPAEPSSDPLVQTIGDASNLFFKNQGVLDTNTFPDPSCSAAQALQTILEPSLAGWGLPFDFMDTSAFSDEVIIAAGSNGQDLIQ
jgi:hypothetical protein